MQGLKAWLQDRRNLPIVLVAFVIIVAMVALYFLKVTGKLGGKTTTAESTTQPYGVQVPGVPGAPTAGPTTPTPAGGTPPGGTSVGAPPPVAGPQPAAGGVAAPTPAPEASATAAGVFPPMLPYRKDPFMPFGGAPRERNVIESMLPSVPRIRLARLPGVKRVEVTEDVPEVLPPQPPRRMAGVMWNGRVAAILETNGQAEIVYPGTISRVDPNVMVDTIEPNCIVLKTLNTRKPFTIRVNMADAFTPSTASAPAATGPGAPRVPGYPPAGVPGAAGPMNP